MNVVYQFLCKSDNILSFNLPYEINRMKFKNIDYNSPYDIYYNNPTIFSLNVKMKTYHFILFIIIAKNI